MINQEKVFVPYEIAKELKEIGFYLDTYFYYDIHKSICFDIRVYMNDNVGCLELLDYKLSDIDLPVLTDKIILAPTYEQAFEWFRDKKLIGIILTNEILNPTDPLYTCSIDDQNEGGQYYTYDDFQTYEEARLECLNQLIKLFKNNKNQ